MRCRRVWVLLVRRRGERARAGRYLCFSSFNLSLWLSSNDISSNKSHISWPVTRRKDVTTRKSKMDSNSQQHHLENTSVLAAIATGHPTEHPVNALEGIKQGSVLPAFCKRKPWEGSQKRGPSEASEPHPTPSPVPEPGSVHPVRCPWTKGTLVLGVGG